MSNEPAKLSPPASNLVTIGALATELGVSVGTIRRWEREGKVSALRTLGNHRRFDMEEVKQRRYGFEPRHSNAA